LQRAEEAAYGVRGLRILSRNEGFRLGQKSGKEAEEDEGKSDNEVVLKCKVIKFVKFLDFLLTL